MVNEGRGRLFKQKNGKFLIYLPMGLVRDSMFPLKTLSTVSVKVSFQTGEKKLSIEQLEDKSKVAMDQQHSN